LKIPVARLRKEMWNFKLEFILKNSIYALFNFETYFLNVSFQIFI
jgi:hypothetical protein